MRRRSERSERLDALVGRHSMLIVAPIHIRVLPLKSGFFSWFLFFVHNLLLLSLHQLNRVAVFERPDDLATAFFSALNSVFFLSISSSFPAFQSNFSTLHLPPFLFFALARYVTR